jgi:hypothetical protein
MSPSQDVTKKLVPKRIWPVVKYTERPLSYSFGAYLRRRYKAVPAVRSFNIVWDKVTRIHKYMREPVVMYRRLQELPH